MNPFELPGPQFLVFYAMLGIAVVFLLYTVRQRAEGGDPVRLPSTDPYLIAYLRGGAAEAIRLGVAILVDRQLLEFDGGDRVARRERVRPMHGGNDLERAILEQCEQATHPGELAQNPRVVDIANRSYEPQLQRLGLLANTETYTRRFREAGLAIVVLAVVAGIKIAIGLARNRPVSFLVVFAVVFFVVAAVMTRGRLTVLGRRVLGDLATLFDGLRGRAAELRPNASTSELALLMAVFGFSAVPVGAFPFVRAFRGATTNESSTGTAGCGSSSGGGCGGGGSSCGGGGSSCGGGGGCGGCGGS
jgi:uncharacterized protein (TIGR04222 family)